MTGGGFGEDAAWRFSFRIEEGQHEGKEFSHAFKYISSNEDEQKMGQSIFADLRNATGVIEPQDTSDFHDCGLLAVVGKMGRIEYATL